MNSAITSEEANNYAAAFTSSESEVLAELRLFTEQNVHGAQMISGHLQGAFLSAISKMLQPKNVLELGTYTGYATICLAQGLAENGTVHTIDNDDKLTDLRKKYWQKAGCEDKIKLYIGNAVEVLPKLDYVFDLVFLDADKKNYELYFDLCLDKMKIGGIIIADNTLFHGEVFKPESERGKAAKSIHSFNEKIANDNSVEQVLLPIRDGITVIRKLNNQNKAVNPLTIVAK